MGDNIKTLTDLTKEKKTRKGGDDTTWAESIDSVFKNISNGTPAEQLAIGGLSGWTVGYVGMKVGKAAAITIGCGLVFLQFASYKGYISVDWARIQSNATEMKRKLQKQVTGNTAGNTPTFDEIQRFFNNHVYLAGGFTAGLFLGLGSA